MKKTAILFAFCAITTSAFSQQKPNILILYADDLGYGDFKPNNAATKVPMPNLEKLATEGVNFTDGHSSSGICTPSRYALLTGRAHWRDFHGIVEAFGKPFFKDGQLTMPGMLREKGYATACIGKWHLGWNWNAIRTGEDNGITPDDFDWNKPIPGGPLTRGFDHYFGDTVINFPPYCWIEDNKVVKAPDTMLDTNRWKEIKEGNWECRPGPMSSDWDPYQNIPETTKRGVEYIRAQKDSGKPFFLYFAYPSPHAPIIPNDEFDGKSQAGPYGDHVFETDHSAGQLLAALEETGQAANTIVIFTADNGPENYAVARKEKFGHWSSEPLRGQKRHIHEGGHRVPTVIRWPGVIKPGTTSDALLAQTDLMATFASLTGYELPDNAAADSFDFLPYLKGEVEKGPRTAMVHNTYREAYAIRDGDWVLVNVQPSGAKSRPKGGTPLTVELHNLKEDISQKNNLAAKYPERVEALQTLLDKLHAQGHTAPRLN